MVAQFVVSFINPVHIGHRCPGLAARAELQARGIARKKSLRQCRDGCIHTWALRFCWQLFHSTHNRCACASASARRVAGACHIAQSITRKRRSPDHYHYTQYFWNSCVLWRKARSKESWEITPSTCVQSTPVSETLASRGCRRGTSGRTSVAQPQACAMGEFKKQLHVPRLAFVRLVKTGYCEPQLAALKPPGLGNAAQVSARQKPSDTPPTRRKVPWTWCSIAWDARQNMSKASGRNVHR